jgi:hypothetical protein
MGWHMSRPAEAAIDAWYEAVNGRGEAPANTTQTEVRGDLLYSYGPHFELARPLRDKRGEIRGYLLNGDTYSNITSQHQQHVRHVLSREETVIIPYEALNSAGIDLETVQIIHTKPDTWTTTKHCTTEMPQGAAYRQEPQWEYVQPSDEDYAEALVKATEDARGVWERRKERHAENPGVWSDPGEFVPPTRNDLWLHSKRVLKGVTETLHTSGRRNAPQITVETLPDGTKEYRWETTRHWLGESLIRARVTWRTFDTGEVKRHHRWAYYLSGFDHEESTPLYFFAELPRGHKPTTVAEAYEALKPDPVKLAEQMNRPIFRQGDIFGVPMETLDRKALKALGARIERRKVPPIPEGQRSVQVTLPYVLNTNHTATEVAYLPDGVTLARGTMYHDPQGRRADHARRRIGDGKSWHVVIKNTVPTTVRR